MINLSIMIMIMIHIAITWKSLYNQIYVDSELFKISPLTFIWLLQECICCYLLPNWKYQPSASYPYWLFLRFFLWIFAKHIFSFITHNLIHNLGEVFFFVLKHDSIVFCSQKHFSILANMFTIFTSNKTLQRKSNFESFLPWKHKDCIPLFDMCA